MIDKNKIEIEFHFIMKMNFLMYNTVKQEIFMAGKFGDFEG